MSEPSPTYDTGDRAEAASREMPRYISQKLVWALKIASIDQAPADRDRVNASGDWLLIPAEPGYAPITVSHDWILKHRPQAGGYFVTYQDGYRSYSPAEAFEAGNTPIDAWGIQRAQEPKYSIGERGRLVNRASGRPIPDDEPIFTLRAQDKLGMQTLQAYRAMSLSVGVDPGSIDERIQAFSKFAVQHPERMKYPNLRSPAPAAVIEQASTALDLSSDAPLAQAGEPKGNGEACDACQ